MVMMDGLSSGRWSFLHLQSVRAGHVSWDSQTGPCQQSWELTRSLGPTPLDAKSAGFSNAVLELSSECLPPCLIHRCSTGQGACAANTR